MPAKISDDIREAVVVLIYVGKNGNDKMAATMIHASDSDISGLRAHKTPPQSTVPHDLMITTARPDMVYMSGNSFILHGGTNCTLKFICAMHRIIRDRNPSISCC